LHEPPTFDRWKRLDDRLYRAGYKHLFELLGIRRAAQAADLIRKFSAATGLDRIDDLLDEGRSGAVIDRVLALIGRL
jgi:hypothetical protein